MNIFECYSDFKNAVVEQASKDYRSAKKDFYEAKRNIDTLAGMLNEENVRSMVTVNDLKTRISLEQSKMQKAKQTISECSRFFKSPQFSYFTKLDGITILEMLENEYI